MTDGSALKSLLSSTCSSVFPHIVVFVVLTHSCGGQSQEAGSPQPVVVMVGNDAVLPCLLKAPMDAARMTMEWGRQDLKPRFVYVLHGGQELLTDQNKAYKGRASVAKDKLSEGDVSLHLPEVKISDNGTYRCYIPKLSTEYFVDLLVGAVSSPGVGFSGLDTGRGAVVLQCESTGWFPEPELLWLDSEGKLLSAGPTQTVRRPDDLYTVSSTVTVEQRHGNSFTCRVQQKNINQTRETRTHVPDDFFLPPPNCAASITSSVVLCLMLFIAVAFFVWKWRQNKINQASGGKREKEQTNVTKTTGFLKKLEKELEEHKKTLTTAEKEAERVAKKTEEKFHSVEKEKDGDQTSKKAQGYLKLKGILTNITWDLNERKEEHQQLKLNTEILIQMTRDEMKRITEEKNRVETHMNSLRTQRDRETRLRQRGRKVTDL
ncbi:butyrophilin subfamily 3 member A3-like [Toxotes jaculatrix]|uniref:butyrophilin subfamily 3 member A3-like n=1 Tax=Toxotes jaculatrix TaxID=941984 RepID=UPI001B3ADFFE|nr:butyrophilin subfamily 3 member A3-like [Toxotes jaculatrix]